MSAQFPSLPDVPNLGDVFSAYPEPLKPIVALLDVVMRGESPLSVGERELIGAYVSGLNACAYCHESHTGFARAFGVDPAVVAALLESIEGAAVDPSMKPLLQYAKVLTESPSRLSGVEAQAVFDAGWDESALFAVVSVCGAFNMMNRIVEGTGCAVGEGDLARWHATRLDSYVGWATQAGLLPS